MISIVMAYHNRLAQLIKTLQSIAAQYPVRDKVEVIIFDENSVSKQSPTNHVNTTKYPFDIRLINSKRLAENPCVAYNKAFTFARGEKIIIQNPECVHVGKIIDCVSDKLTDTNYLSFSTFALDQANTNSFVAQPGFSLSELSQLYKNTSGSWYNHPTFCPVNYHFCTAITAANLKSLGGFDERYKDGKCFDDNEFVVRVKRKGLTINPVTWPMAIHLWHAKTENPFTQEWQNMWIKNKTLFNNVTLKETSWNPKNQQL